MKDEIKEIKINTIGQLLDYVETKEKANELIYYITNLQEEIHKKEAMYDSLAVDYRLSQEENERLEKRNKEIYDGFIATQEELSDYATRIDKAIEYLEQQPVIEINGEYRNIYAEDDNKLLNILKGSDE